MNKELREVLDLLKGLEERANGLAPLPENAEDADIEARSKELEAIAEERKSLEARKAQLEEEQRAAEALLNNPHVGSVVENRGEVHTMTLEEIRSSEAYRDAFVNAIKNGNDDECRALLTENATNGTVPVPTIVDEIVRTAWEKDGIMSRVKKLYAKGNVKIGFEVSAEGAVKHTEGGNAITAENLILGTVEIKPSSIKKMVKISDEALDMTGDAFLQYIYDEVTHQIAKKAAEGVIDGIEACGTVATSTCVGVPVVTSSTVSVGLVAEALAALSDEATDPVVILNKATWGEFKKAQYANKFNIDPFEGLPVVYCNHVKSFAAASSGDTFAIVGDLAQGAVANFPNGEEIEIKIDDKTDMDKDLVRILGREFVGIGIVGPDAFVKIQK